MYLFKYVSEETLRKIFENEGRFGFKFSYPSDYNDPFELFLKPGNVADDPEALALFCELFLSIPKLPTTCFSVRPDIIPMWAHYANNSSGCIIGVSEEKMRARLPHSAIDSVEYKVDVEPIDAFSLKYAAARRKPRHTYILARRMFSSAYFTKKSQWAYEMERRIVVQGDDLALLDDNMILEFDVDCIDALISGPKAETGCVSYCRDLGEAIGCEFYTMHVGKSTVAPFFVGDEGTCLFDAGMFVSQDAACSECAEPVEEGADMCVWCSITEDDIADSAARNPLRLLDRYGLLDEYAAGMRKI